MEKSNYYDKVAQIYDRSRWLTESVAEEVADVILERVNATPETTFLEPGVGTGLNVIPLVKRGYAVTGIDISQPMLDRFRQKLSAIPPNLNLICGDASKLPFADDSFDIILTVHMVHTVADWQVFLDEVDRVLKPNGFYLNAQWITPPARREFEGHFRKFLSKYDVSRASQGVENAIAKINVDGYFQQKGYRSNYTIAKEWMVTNPVSELLNFLRCRAYGLCWQVPDERFEGILDEFEAFCTQHYESLNTQLSSPAKFEIWTYTASR